MEFLQNSEEIPKNEIDTDGLPKKRTATGYKETEVLWRLQFLIRCAPTASMALLART